MTFITCDEAVRQALNSALVDEVLDQINIRVRMLQQMCAARDLRLNVTPVHLALVSR